MRVAVCRSLKGTSGTPFQCKVLRMWLRLSLKWNGGFWAHASKPGSLPWAKRHKQRTRITLCPVMRHRSMRTGRLTFHQRFGNRKETPNWQPLPVDPGCHRSNSS